MTIQMPQDVVFVTPSFPTELQQKCAEDIFRRALKDHDFFYEYSDDGRVYREGRTKTDALKRTAVSSGLTQQRVDAIYTEEYNLRVSK